MRQTCLLFIYLFIYLFFFIKSLTLHKNKTLEEVFIKIYVVVTGKPKEARSLYQ